MPTVRLTAPPAPVVAAPFSVCITPLVPELVVPPKSMLPEPQTTAPLTSSAPALGNAMMIAPLVVAVL